MVSGDDGFKHMLQDDELQAIIMVLPATDAQQVRINHHSLVTETQAMYALADSGQAYLTCH